MYAPTAQPDASVLLSQQWSTQTRFEILNSLQGLFYLENEGAILGCIWQCYARHWLHFDILPVDLLDGELRAEVGVRPEVSRQVHHTRDRCRTVI